MNPEPNKKRLKEMLETFSRGDDRSLGFANKIEGFVIEHFYEDEMFQGLLTALASYTPGGGDLLYDEGMLLKVVDQTLRLLE